MKTIGENIAYYRKQKKLTQEGLAEILSVTAQAVSKWECDSSYPDITVMSNLAKTLGVTVDDILTGEQKIPEVKEAEPEKIVNINDLLEELIQQSVALVGKPVALMNKDDKVKAIQCLNQNGAFLVTKSGDKIAKYFGISKYTLYSYIDTKQQEGKTT